MDIAGSLANGFGNDQVDQVDDGGLIGHHLDVMQILAFNRGAAFRVEILDHPLNRDLVTLGHLFQDVRDGNQGLHDLETAQKPDVIHHPFVARLGGGDMEDSS